VAEGGDFVNVLEASGDWYRVEYDGTVGWVSGAYLGPARDRGTLSARGSRRGGDAVVTEGGVLLRVPYRTQLDGSAYAGANCGPASVGMALEAFGTYLETIEIRRAANRLQGTTGWYDSGTSLDVLAAIAARNGLVVRGLHGEGGYDRWSFDEVRRALRNGHVVIPQVHLATLPGQEHSNRAVDHFIVIVGYEDGRFIYHDPAFVGGGGHSLQIAEERLELAWKRSDYPFAAFSLGPGPGTEPLIAPMAPHRSAPAAEPLPAPAPPVVALPDSRAASAALRRLLEAEAATPGPAPQTTPPLADPVAADVPEPATEIAPTEPEPTPAAAAPTAAPAPRFMPTRAWPLVMAAVLALALLGSRRVASSGRLRG
jgi:hypothetical protein